MPEPCATLSLSAGIFFDVGLSDLRPEAEPDLAQIVAFIKTNVTKTSAAVQIVGHTDSDGDAASNQSLSERRAQAVVNWIIARNPTGLNIRAVGLGEDKPVADNATVEGRTKNRRVEVSVIC